MLTYWQTLTKDANTKRQTDRWEKLFQDKETRYGYIDGFLDSFLGMQIRVLREQKGWNQSELAEKAGMKQSRIPLLESMSYSSWSLYTLRKLAKAFDLRLVVKFEDFSSFVPEYFEDFDRENLKRRSFGDDIIFNNKERYKAVNPLITEDTTQNKQLNTVIISKTRKVKTRLTKPDATPQLNLPFGTFNSNSIEAINTSFAKDVEVDTEYQLSNPIPKSDTEENRYYILPVQDFTGSRALH